MSSARVIVFVMEGSNAPGGVDRAVQQFPQLQRPPFSAYSRIRLISRSEQPLTNTGSTVDLPDSGRAIITSAGMLPNGRYEVSVRLEVSGRTHNLQFSATPGEPFFNVRATSATAALVLAIIVR